MRKVCLFSEDVKTLTKCKIEHSWKDVAGAIMKLWRADKEGDLMPRLFNELQYTIDILKQPDNTDAGEQLAKLIVIIIEKAESRGLKVLKHFGPRAQLLERKKVS